jgi:RHS repeat-associated protein
MNARFRSPRRLIAALLLAASVFVACPQPVPLPLAGWAEFTDPLFARVPGGNVNTGGGNFLTRRTDLSIDTRVGTYAVGAVYNSASGGWHWAHEMTYSGATFVDETGASFNLSSVAHGSPIAGTHWVRLDADSMKTKGGLVYDFSPSGKLAAIHWLGFDYPRLRFTAQVIGGGVERVTAIDQCTAASACVNFFSLAYDASARLITVTDRASRTASFSWDGSGRLATAKDGLDNEKSWLGFRYEYSGTNLTAITNSENERVEYTYDTSARLLTAKKIGDGDPAWTFTYFGSQPNGYYATRLTNPLGEITRYHFDGGRRLFSLELVAVAELASFQWTGNRVTRVTGPDGVQINFTIVDDDVTQVIEASGNVINVSYAPNAIDPDRPNARPVDAISDSVGSILDRTYDLQGRLISVSNGAGDTTSLAWQTGSPTALASVTTPLGLVTTYGAQGDHGHPASAATGAYLTKDFSYDMVGNMLDGQDTSTELSPGMGGVVSRTFDADRNVATVLLKSMVPSVHDETLTLVTRSDGRLKAIRPPSGGDTEFDYSPTGRVLALREKADGAWVTTSFGYDAVDRVSSTELANGMRAEIAFDGAGRTNAVISKRSGVIEETLSRTFSGGRLTLSNDTAYAAAETLAYDSAGRVSTVTYPGGERRELTYDVRSRVVTERFIDSLDTTVVELHYSYDLADRITEVRRGALNVLVLRYTYANGFLTETQYQNGLRRTATPSVDFGLPDATATVNASSQTIENTYNDLNPVLILKESEIGGSSFSEQYALSSEWRAVVDTGSSSTKWDAASNVREMAGREFLYNAEKNRLTQVRDIAAPQTVRHAYTYDAAGFVTNRDGVALTYDATGAIASIGAVAAFEHDLDGRPVSRTLNGVTKHFRFGGAIAYSSSGTPLEMDLGDVVINLDGGGNRFRHMDFRGNVMFVSRGNGTVDGMASYRAFGQQSASGALGDRGFAGGFEIPSLGLVVLGPRVLDSDAGRFLSQDPIFNAVNLYTYAQGNPVFMWDPSGLLPTLTELAFGSAGRAGAIAGGLLATAAVVSAPVSAPVAILAIAGGITYGAIVGLAAANQVSTTVNPAGPRMTAGDAGNFLVDFWLGELGLQAASVSGGGSSSAAGGIQGGSGDPPGPNHPRWGEMHPEIYRNQQIQVCSGGFCVGGSPLGSVGAIYGLGSLNFSISLSFGGAMW